MPEKNKPAMRYALAGRIVSTSRQARRILREAILSKQEHLVPQARSVLRRLEAAEGSQ